MDNEHDSLLYGWRYGDRVALDIDSVIADVLTPIVALYNMRNGTNYTVNGGNGSKKWRIGLIPAEEFLPLYYVPAWKNHADIPLLVDKELLRQASHYYRISLVSSRSEDTVLPLWEWLNERRVEGFETLVSGPGLNKASLDYRLYIDDDKKLAERIQAAPERRDGVPLKVMFLVSMFNNLDVKDSDRVMRVDDVNTALRALVRVAESSETEKMKKVKAMLH